MAHLRQAWMEAHPAEPFMRAVRELVQELPQVPTQASAQLWVQNSFQVCFQGRGLVDSKYKARLTKCVVPNPTAPVRATSST